MRISLVPAYGRDYKSKAAIVADLKAGKDFITAMYGTPDKPINLQQIREGALGYGESIQVRYAGQRKVVNIKLGELLSDPASR